MIRRIEQQQERNLTSHRPRTELAGISRRSHRSFGKNEKNKLAFAFIVKIGERKRRLCQRLRNARDLGFKRANNMRESASKKRCLKYAETMHYASRDKI